MSLSQGEILNNRYRIVKLLGQGGFGAVYRAWDVNLEAPVAVKECFDVTPRAQKQFKLEAQLLFKLHHNNLPRVHDHFIIPNQGQYLVMDFVEGQDLGEMLKSGPLPEAKVLPWISQICDALSYLHSQNPPVIHRDIKPGNIKITPEGKAMLVDFGISKIYDPALVTTVGARAVTPGYSPPEQYGQGATDIKSDLYALGATLYHLLTGQLPPDSVDILAQNVPAPPPVIDLNAAISQAVGEAVKKAMALNRKDRWENAQEFKQAITTQPSARQKVASPIPATEVVPPPAPIQTVPDQVQTSIQDRKTPWLWIAAIIVIVFVIGYVVAVGNQPAPTPEVIVQTEEVGIPSTNTSLPVVNTTETFPNSTTPSSDFIDEYGVKMKLIPAGEFQMGSESGDDGESPVHTVYLDAFYIDIYEVTNALFEMCVNASACSEPKYEKSNTRDSYYGNSTYDDYPVIYVDWNQARDFCEWRGACLPTEAEWEKAARGGLEGKLYPWGDQAPDCSMANYRGEDGYCEGNATRVGSFAPNPFGLFDMVGNVWEWVMDWYDANYYSNSSTRNPTGPSSGEYRVLRGGSWYLYGNSLRVASRYWYYPVYSLGNFGFRCTRSP